MTAKKIESEIRADFLTRIIKEKIGFYEEDGKIIINREGDVYLGSLENLPDCVIFKNKGDVHLESIRVFPAGVIFENEGYVYLGYLKYLPQEVEPEDEGDDYFRWYN